MDPYYLIKQEVLTGTERLHDLLDTRDDMIQDPRGINIEVFKTLGIQMTNEVNNVRGLLRDIEETMEQIRGNPDGFDISDVELSNRMQFTVQTAAELNAIEDRMKEQSINHKVAFYPGSSTPDRETTAQNDQEQLLAERQETIDMIHETVSLQLQVAKEIDQELGDQQQVLLALDDNIETAQEAMQNVTQKIKQIIENEGAVPTTLVVLLSIALVVLLFIAA